MNTKQVNDSKTFGLRLNREATISQRYVDDGFAIWPYNLYK